jgi:5-methylcytosine-specific restriction endonuclease McrA
MNLHYPKFRASGRRYETDYIQQYRHMAVLEQGYRCHYCRGPITHENSTADHKVPRANGGRTEHGNILASCHPCNLAKGQISYRKFRTCLKSILPPEADYPTHLYIRLAWVRRRLNTRIQQAEKRIKRAVGMTA